MFEFRGAREAEREFAERGSASGIDRSVEQANREDTFSQIQENLATAAMIQAAADRAAQSEQFRQAGYDAYAAQTQDAIDQLQRQMDQPRAPAMTPLGLGLDAFGGYMRENMMGQLQDALSRERFLTDRRLVAPVYGPTGMLTGVRDEYGRLTGRDPIAEAAEQERRMLETDGQPEIVSTVQDPATGQERCPDGYIFDEDLQACRKKPMERAAVDTTPGERYIRSGLLDVAPEGLMGFQERYGAGFGSPMDFAAANRAFRMGGAVTPSFYSAPPKLDGYTLLT